MLELTQWKRTLSLPDRPWLMLGKGPSFSMRKDFDLTQYNLLSLNHVVRAQHVDVAHIIDIDVVEACADELLQNCRYLVMPRRPHVHCDPGPKLLEDYFEELPVLRQLAAENRLVWYNLSSSAPVGDSPVIGARWFSAEAALNILALVGAKQIRSLGIDGGRGYSAEFADLERHTMLANGHETFNQQFDEMDAACQRHGINYAPLVEPMRVFVGTDESQRVASRVLEYSIRKHTPGPVNFHPMFHLPIPTPKDPANRPRTGFSFFRFAIPKLCGYRGRALYVDADMQVFSDLAELWRIPFGKHKVMCTNQPETPSAWQGKNAFFHPGRQMSVMLLDCSRLDWDPDKIIADMDAGKYGYRDLMFEMCVVRPDEISDDIPPEWNCLEWHDPQRTKLLHYTVVPTQPWKNDENPLGPVWMQCYREAVEAGIVVPAEVRQGIAAGHLKASLADVLPAVTTTAPAPRSFADLHAAHAPREAIRPSERLWATPLGRAAKRPLRFLKRALLG